MFGNKQCQHAAIIFELKIKQRELIIYDRWKDTNSPMKSNDEKKMKGRIGKKKEKKRKNKEKVI